MSEINVAGIRSELVFDLAKWTGPVNQAAQDATRVGNVVETAFVEAQAATSQAMAVMASSIANAILPTEQLAESSREMAQTLISEVVQADRLATAANAEYIASLTRLSREMVEEITISDRLTLAHRESADALVNDLVVADRLAAESAKQLLAAEQAMARTMVGEVVIAERMAANEANRLEAENRLLVQSMIAEATIAEKLGASFDRLSNELRDVAQASNSVKPPPLPPPTTVVNWSAGLRSLTGVIGMANPQLGQLASGFMAAEGAAAASGLSIAAVVPVVVAAAGAIAAATTTIGFAIDSVKMAATAAQSAVKIEAFLGSAKAAKALIAELDELNKHSLQTRDEIMQSASQLLAYDTPANEVTDTLRRLSDVAAGVNKPLSQIVTVYGQVQQKGQLYSEELQQFAEMGIPLLRVLGQQFGVTAAEAKSMIGEGLVGFPELQRAIRDLTDEGGTFFDMNRKQSEQLAGSWQQLGKAWDDIKRQVGDVIIAEVDLKSVVKETTDLVKSQGPAIVAVMKEGAAATREFVEAFKPAVDLGRELHVNTKVLGAVVESIVPPVTEIVKSIMVIPNALAQAISYGKQFYSVLQDIEKKTGAISAIMDPTGVLHGIGKAGSWAFGSSGTTPATPAGNSSTVLPPKTPANAPAVITPSTSDATSSGPVTSSGSTGDGNGSGGKSKSTKLTPEQKAAKEQSDSQDRARELAHDNFIQSLKLRGAKELAELMDRRHKAEVDAAKAKTEAERQQIKIAMEFDLEEIRQKYAKDRADDAKREKDKKDDAADRLDQINHETHIQKLQNQGMDEQAEAWRAFYSFKEKMAKATSDEERAALQRNLQAEYQAIRQKYEEIRAREAEKDQREKERENKKLERDAKKNGHIIVPDLSDGDRMVDLKDAAKNERDPSKRTLAQLDLREQLGHTLSVYNKGRQNRLRDMVGDSGPSIAARAAQTADALSGSRTAATRGGADGAGGGINANINIDADAVANKIISKVTPVVTSIAERAAETAVKQINQRAKLDKLNAAARRGA